ncbi:MAG: SDR family oxidoreductase [Hyphomonadaceae bacterium]
MTKTVLVTDFRGFANPVIAARLVRNGVRVLATDPSISADGEENGVELLAADTPRSLVRRAADKAREGGGRLDGAVISSAMPAPRLNAEDLTEEALTPYFANIAAVSLAFGGAALEVMKPNKAGRIVFGSSSGPIGGIPGFSAYAAARGAVNAAVRSLALEAAPHGVSVNAIAANFIQTETYYPKALLDDPVKGPKLLARVPMGRLGDAEEVAALAEFLAVGDCGFLSGQVISISGAWC